jgi:hypothetical protein
MRVDAMTSVIQVEATRQRDHLGVQSAELAQYEHLGAMIGAISEGIA